MKAISLYSGGCDGMGVAAEKAGIQTLSYCDNEEACRVLLHTRHPEIPIFDSDTEVTEDGLQKLGINPSEIDMVYGAPPCQCASVAGKRLGDGDERNRWPEFLRIVRGIRPRWVVAENVPGLLSVNAGRLFGGILRELAEAGYSVEWNCWGACDVGAPHGRKRLLIIAKLGNTKGDFEGRLSVREGAEKPGFERRSEDVADAYDTEATRYRQHGREVYGKSKSNGFDGGSKGRGATQPGLGGNADGVSRWLDETARILEEQKWPAGKGQAQYDWEPPRVENGVKDRKTRLHIIGNSCPWQQYYPIFSAIAQIERGCT